MKKLIYLAASLAALLFAGSCQRESLEPEIEGTTVSYTVQLPDAMTTKAGATYSGEVNKLVYEVHRIKEDETTYKLYQKTVDITNGVADLEIEFVKGQNFKVLFWAQKEGVYNTGDLTAVKVPTSLTSNSNDYEAFYGTDDVTNGNVSATGGKVNLTRAVSLLNIGTSQASLSVGEATVALSQSAVTVKGLHNTLNIMTGDVTNDVSDHTYASAGVPSGTLTVGTENYVYVAKNYVGFADADKSTVDVDFTITLTDGSEVKHSIPSVPLKRNYKTNIIGDLITAESDYTITLVSDWGEGEFYGPEFVKEPAYDADTKTYTVVDRYELLWVAQQVNTGAKDFYGETVQLAADIDLENKPWTPIGLSTSECFKGMFEGVALTKAGDTYPTIKNLYIENGNCAGLFKVLCNGGKARNFNMKNVRISGERQLGAVAGTVYSSIENVTVEDVQITAVPAFDGTVYDNGDKVGGIAGLDGQSATISGCTVKNATFKGYRDMGGIIGSTQNSYPTTITGNTVENLKFIVTSFYTPYMDDAEAGHYAPVRGGRRSNAGDKVENNTGDDITLHKVLVEAAEGGIYDAQEKVYTVTSPAGLEKALEGAGAAGAGDHTINIESDLLDMTGMDWTPINVDGYHGADIVTVEGNGATIKGLDGALFAGGFAGGSGIVIKDLTIEGAYMIADNTQGYGAFVNCADSMEEITLINCHLKNSTIITPNDGAAESRIGGLVGWTAGYNNPNDGPVDTYVTIKNCSVTGCTIKGAGSIGGIVGHSGGNAATFTTVEDCTVQNNTFASTDDGDWRVGVVVGTANVGQMTISGITASNNTLTQTGKTMPAHSELYGRFVPGTTGTLVINGIDESLGYVKNEDGSYTVSSAVGLVNAFALTDATIINLLPGIYDLSDVCYIKHDVTLNAVDTNKKPLIKGKLVAEGTFAANNVKFGVNDATSINLAKGTYGTYVVDNYNAIVTVHKVAASFEGCEFDGGEDYKVAINYFMDVDSKVLDVHNCSFTNTYIYTKVLCNISDNTFNLGNCPYAICVWPRYADTTNSKCVFKNNVISSTFYVDTAMAHCQVQLLSQSSPYANVMFDVQGNQGNFKYTWSWTNSVRCATDGSVTFAEGSKTFEIKSDGTL